jgi:hypothetical protein
MGVTDWNQLTSITREKVLPKIQDQIGVDHPLLKRLWDNIKLWNGGRRLEIPVKYRHNSQGGSYSGLDILDTGQEQTRTRAYFNIKQIYQPIVLSNIDLAMNGGEGKVADLMDAEMDECKESLTDKLCTQLFSDGTGNSSKDLTGLKAAVGNDGTATASYGDITLATYTWFQGQYTASIGSLMLSDLATMMDECTSGNDTPSIIVTTKTIKTAYEALLQNQVRFQMVDGKISADGGITDMSFRTVPMIADEYCTTGDMYFINEKYLQLYYMKHPKYPTDAKGFAMSPMREPVDQDGEVGFIFSYIQLVNKRPARSGRLAGVTA